MKKIKPLACLAFVAYFASCNSKETVSNNGPTSWEIKGKDTCNRVINGLKQGKWYLIDSAKLRKGERVITDTVFYKDNVLIN